jgi:3-hydroxybutyryl-CoA dehydrogenase
MYSKSIVGTNIDKMKTYTSEEEKLKEKIGVIGAGVMGTGITEIFMISGFNVILSDKTYSALKNAIKKIKEDLSKNRSVAEKNKLIKNLHLTTNLNHFKNADIVIEAITEDIRAKIQLFKKLNRILSKKTIIATNTSSLSINKLASIVSNPARFIGMHFFNPVFKMKLVEIVYGEKTSKTTVNKIKKILTQINKTPIVIRDSPGFLVNRMLMPYLNEAIWELYEGVATAEDIDTAAKLGLNHPIGPIALTDLIGLDVVLAIMKNLYQRTKNRKYLPCPIIKKMVKEGKLGRKTKEGFYQY